MNKTKSQECFIIGTRPTVIKFASLVKEMNGFVIHTGQHAELAHDMYKAFDIIPDIDLKLMTDNQTLTEFLSKTIVELDKIVKKHKFKRIWVHGDTSSGLAGAIVAAINQIPLIHNEAGLRSFDKKNPFPEEIFRKMIDSTTDIYFAPTRKAVKHLQHEGIIENVHRVGNTVIDALKIIDSKLPADRPIKEKYVLATVHRRESFGSDLEEIFKALKELSKEIKVVLPAHPNPNVRKILDKVGLKYVEPMNYIDFIWHLKHCEYVISDSGGIQEEAPTFNKKVIILRKTTERQEVVELGYGILIDVMQKDNILEKIKTFTGGPDIEMENPFGDGQSAKLINNIIKTYYEKG